MPGTPAPPAPAFRPVRRPVAVRAAGRAPHVPGLPDPPEWYRLDDLEVMAVGEQVDSDGRPMTWTPELLRAAADNVNLHAAQSKGRLYSTVAVVPFGDPLQPDLGIDHDHLQRHLNEFGAANAGLLESARFDDASGKLLVSAGRIPPAVAEAVRDGKLVAVSAEMYDTPPKGISGSGPCVRRVSLLGHKMPAVKTLAPPPTPAPDYQTYSEAGRLTRPHVPDAPVHVYAEGRTMAKAKNSLLDAYARLVTAGMAPEDRPNDEFLGSLSEEQWVMLGDSQIPDETAEESAGGGGAMAARTPETDQAIIAADPTQTAETLKAMTDADYWAKWSQATGQAAPTGGATTMQYTETGPRRGAPAIDVDAIARQITAKVRDELKAELEPTRQAVKAEADQVRAYSERQEREYKEKRIDAVVDEALKWGVFTPGDDDTTNPARPNRRQRLKLLDNRAPAHTYAEQGTGREVKLTQLDLELAELEERIKEAKAKAPHGYSEAIPQDRRPPNGNAPTPERLDQLLGLTHNGRAALALRNAGNN